MRSRVKKLTRLALLGSVLATGAAQACTSAPIVFVHGYSGWGSQFDSLPYACWSRTCWRTSVIR